MNSSVDRVLFTRARIDPSGDSGLVDIAVEDGLVTRIVPQGSFTEGGFRSEDVRGHLVLPGLVEPHAHLDKALTADVVPNPRGDLMGAIEAWVAAEDRGLFDLDSMTARAVSALRRLASNGVTAVRSHVNVGASDPDQVHLRAIKRARRMVGDAMDVQIVALMHSPMAGPDGRDNRAALESAIESGVDLVGGCPHLESDGVGMIDIVCRVAADAGLGLDLHVDETLDPSMLTLRRYCEAVGEIGFAALRAASHCVSLSMQTPDVQNDIASLAAAVGVDIVALPQTNLFLQGRDHPVGMPRGITPVDVLRDAGVRVVAGGDNVQDPFNPVGRSDPLETAALMIMAAHQLPQAALDTVSNGARAVLGLPPAGPGVGAVADFLVVDALTARQAIADAPMTRRTYRRGRLTASSEVTRTFDGLGAGGNW